MPQNYAPEFKKKIVRLYEEEGQSYKSIIVEYGVSNAAISAWCKQFRDEYQISQKQKKQLLNVFFSDNQNPIFCFGLNRWQNGFADILFRKYRSVAFCVSGNRLFFLVKVPCQIHEGRVRNACGHKNNITGDSNRNQCLCIIGAQKCAPCEQDCV